MRAEPHVMLLPFTAQGHIKPMLCLAELLSHAGVAVTFVNSRHNHRLLAATIEALSSRFPSLRFEAISDGYPDDHPRTYDSNGVIAASFAVSAHRLVPQLVASSQTSRPVTAIIADATLTFAIDIAAELGIPGILLQTSSAAFMWAFHGVPKLIQEGQIPFTDEDMDREVKGIPGMENILRVRDLPGTCRLPLDNLFFKFFIEQGQKLSKASAVILNAIQDLEAPILSHVATVIPNTYIIGPLHLLSKSLGIDAPDSSASKGSLWEQDRTCMAWLDSQPSQSVLYVSFGSTLRMTKEQLMEFWHGLSNSGKPFLWVVRSDILDPSEGGENELPEELEAGTTGKGCIVRWIHQEEVLAHRAVGGFLTHGGWNSIMEAIVAGVPMICWAERDDQQVNGRWVSEVWKIGFDMKDTCDRATIEKMTRDLMEDKREGIMRSTSEVSRMARECIKESGSSFQNLQKLVDFIKSQS